MTSVAIPIQGFYNPISGQLLLNLPELVNQESFIQPNRESQKAVILQNTTVIRKSSLHFCSSALGVMGGIGFIVSCLSSILLPAIASIGVIGIAYLAKRKIAPLQVKDLSLENTKAQEIFQKKEKSSTNQEGALNLENNLQTPLNPMHSNIDDFDYELDEEFDDDLIDDVTIQPTQITNQNENEFLSQVRSYIIQEDGLNCENLRRALCEESYQDCFVPKQLLEELLSTYQSIQGEEFRGIKNKKSEVVTSYVQDKISFIQKELKKDSYQQGPNQEQEDFMKIIHEQSKKEQLNSASDFDKYKFLDRKMTLIGTLYEVLGQCKSLDKGSTKNFSDKANHAYEHAMHFRKNLKQLTA
ncbi:MAG: hypothetical protein ACRDDW_00555 [Candidatus Rhabdochlamydia sp.]